MGSLMKPPGPMMDRPALAASSGVLPVLAAIWVRTSTPLANSASGLKPYCASTMMAMKVTPDSSSTALMICTQVVAVMPPKSTYTIISAPTMATAIQYSRPNSSLIS